MKEQFDGIPWKPSQIIPGDVGRTLGLLSLCEESKSVSACYKENEEKKLFSNQISLIQFIQQVPVSDIGHAVINKMFDTIQTGLAIVYHRRAVSKSFS